MGLRPAKEPDRDGVLRVLASYPHRLQVSKLEPVAPGLRRWSSWHPEWRQEVGSAAVDTPDGLVLIEPLDPPPEVRSPAHVLLTVFWHARTAGDLGAEHVWAPARGVRKLKNRGVVVTDPFEADPELPGGIKAVPTAREGEVVYWLRQQNWLDGAKTRQLVKSLLPLLDLPLERILVSHGDPVLQGGKEVLRNLIAPEKP